MNETRTFFICLKDGEIHVSVGLIGVKRRDRVRIGVVVDVLANAKTLVERYKNT